MLVQMNAFGPISRRIIKCPRTITIKNEPACRVRMTPALSKQSEPPWAASQNQLSCRAVNCVGGGYSKSAKGVGSEQSFNRAEIEAGFDIVNALGWEAGTFIVNRATEADHKLKRAKHIETLATR